MILTRVAFADLVDLASARVGGQVLGANDEFFAAKENLIRPEPPIFIADKYVETGKWMDGWESRRKRVPGHDWCSLRLGIAGVVEGINVDTSHFTGNYPEYGSIDAASSEKDSDLNWTEILAKSPLNGDSQNFFSVASPTRWTHLRLNIFPDGGVARLRAYGRAQPDWARLKKAGGLIDFAAIENGGKALACSDRFYSHPDNLILPGRSQNMGDGWETKRRRGPGNDWVILRLGSTGRIKRIEIDTNHYKGNFPESASIEACRLPQASRLLACDFRDRSDIVWEELLPRTPLKADHRHLFEKELRQAATSSPFDHIRLQIYPDGGISRLRILGEVP